ncbi:MAG TPA: alpha/beta hydrolase, partial [Sulfurovum sp.]|nr:alpha/beta hydrolase [Sulfurovum sp.]
MKLVLLSGLDGTAKLFEPFIKALPRTIDAQVIAYPTDKKLDYQSLISLVENELPKTEEFVLLAESF